MQAAQTWTKSTTGRTTLLVAGPTQPERESRPAERLGRFLLLRKIGSGGMGLVYKAFDPATRRLVAVKTPMSPHGAAARLRRRSLESEYAALLDVRGRHVIRAYEADLVGRVPYIALELIEGITLAQTTVSGPIPVRRLAPVLVPLVRALRSVHEAGYVHRDVKPSNVLLGRDGRVVLADFGLATPVSATQGLALGSSIAGTPSYMSPEQMCGEEEVDARSDLFSFGCVLYECLCGRPPFRGSSLEEVQSMIRAGAPPIVDVAGRGVSPAMAALTSELLSTDRAERPSSAREVEGRLLRAMEPRLRPSTIRLS